MNDYILKIADENGEIEEELAALESSQRVGRFGFSFLALLEKSDSQASSPLLEKSIFRKLSKKVSVIM